MSFDRSTAAVRAVNDFGLTQGQAADLFDVSQEWVARELHEHFEDEEDGQEDTCPICGDTYDHKREATSVTDSARLRGDATECKSDPDWSQGVTYYVHRDGTPPGDDRDGTMLMSTSPTGGRFNPADGSLPGPGLLGVPDLGVSDE